MSWPETYNKRKDTELMKEFGYFYIKSNFPKSTKTDLKRQNIDEWLSQLDIKDIWGYFVCFAEMKGYKILLGYNHCLIAELVGSKVYANSYGAASEKRIKNSEQAMNWCINKFFEVAK